MVDTRKIKPKKTKKVIKPKVKIKEEVKVDWDEIWQAVEHFAHERPEDYIILNLSHNYILVGKRVKLTTVTKNENNIFQSYVSEKSVYHYKYFHLYNYNDKGHIRRFDSPKYCPMNVHSALEYMAAFE